MSIIGDFGICSKTKYDELINLIQNNNCKESEKLIQEIHSEVESSSTKLENGKCSGEVFIGLFDYFETAHEVDVRFGLESFGEKWREATGDFDVIAFCGKEQILSLEDKIDFNELVQSINDFYQSDYGDAGRIACSVLFNNLKRVGEEEVLILHIF